MQLLSLFTGYGGPDMAVSALTGADLFAGGKRRGRTVRACETAVAVAQAGSRGLM